jgi:alpha-beta hydrolase superfamily lysophospholipase
MVRVGAAILCCALTLARAVQAASGDALPRRGTLGVSLDVRDGTVTVATVVPTGPAQAAGIESGDRVVALDGTPVTSIAGFLQRIRRPAGETVVLVVARNGQQLSKSIVLAPYPKETDPQVTTSYESVAVDGTLRRTLVTTPNNGNGRRPGVFFVGGIGCFSVDVADPQDGYRNLAHALSRAGFVTMRLEKSGVGDSQGPPCYGVDFETESRSYTTALQAFLADPRVDSRHVYVLGHSIGTVIAPRLAAAQQAAGVIVIAAVARSWFEYELINWRRQMELDGTKPQTFDTEMHLKEWCMHRMLIEKQSVEAAMAERPDCKNENPYPVTIRYVQQVADLNILEPWTKLDVPVLAVYGGSDFITDRADHQLIVDTVNGIHPGNGSFVLVDDMDHYWWTESSQQASLQNLRQGRGGTYDQKLSEIVVAWLCARERCAH